MDDLLTFSDFLVFVDESGDHELTKIDPQYPVFVLLFCIIKKVDYSNEICPRLQKLKFKYWGHDEVVLHEHEIRKPRNQFSFLMQKSLRERFLEDLTAEMIFLPATVVAVVIDKPAYVRRYNQPISPYDYAMETGLERVYSYLKSEDQDGRTTSIIVETRGRREDAELELAFHRVCDGSNILGKRLPFQIVMIPKSSNSCGLQLTDLMARPVGLHHLRPHQPNRAFDIIEAKLRRSPTGNTRGWGLKVLP